MQKQATRPAPIDIIVPRLNLRFCISLLCATSPLPSFQGSPSSDRPATPVIHTVHDRSVILPARQGCRRPKDSFLAPLSPSSPTLLSHGGLLFGRPSYRLICGHAALSLAAVARGSSPHTKQARRGSKGRPACCALLQPFLSRRTFIPVTNQTSALPRRRPARSSASSTSPLPLSCAHAVLPASLILSRFNTARSR